MTWNYPRGRYRWCGTPPARWEPVRAYVDTDEGLLSYLVKGQPWQPEGRRHLAYLDGHRISDDEVEMRLAALQRSA